MNNFMHSEIKKYAAIAILILAVLTYVYATFFMQRPQNPADYSSKLEETKTPEVERDHTTPGTAESIGTAEEKTGILILLGNQKFEMDKVSYTIEPNIETDAVLIRNDTTLRITPKNEDWKQNTVYKITVNSSKEIFDYYFKVSIPENMPMGF